MQVDKITKSFATFLSSSWNSVQPLLKNRSYTDDEASLYDWIQANWELLIERKILSLNNYLEPYGQGADFNGSSSRITDIEAIATHTLRVYSKKPVREYLNNQIIDTLSFELIFEEFVTIENHFYTYSPPFDYTLTRDKQGEKRVFHLDDIFFEIKKVAT